MGAGRVERNRKPSFTVTAGVFFTLALAAPAHAVRNYDYNGNTMSQKDTGGFASNNFWNGSGDSKDEGVNEAMKAMNCIAALDIGGAFHHGYKGYGEYINSQKMDDLDNAAWNVKASLNSVNPAAVTGSTSGAGDSSSVTGASGASGSGQAAGGSAPAGAASHMLASMDKGFLYRGETGDVASEFEKKSGMSRETFFNELAAAEASGLSWNDPNVLDKMEARYQSFISKIPNQEYKANIEKMHSLFNAAKKMDVLAKASDFYKSMRWGNGGAQLANAAADAKASSVTAAGAGGAGDAASRNPASSAITAAVDPATALAKADDKSPKLTKEQMGMYLGLEGNHGDALNDFLGPEDSIFHTVTKRYRKLTPMMIGRTL